MLSNIEAEVEDLGKSQSIYIIKQKSNSVENTMAEVKLHKEIALPSNQTRGPKAQENARRVLTANQKM